MAMQNKIENTVKPQNIINPRSRPKYSDGATLLFFRVLRPIIVYESVYVVP
jgi:hypothetical protein